MEIILTGMFARYFFLLGTVVVLYVAWSGYYKNRFSTKLAWATSLLLIAYTFTFMWYKHAYVSHNIATEQSYMIIAAIHGAISMWAILQACVMFMLAHKPYQRGVNFFRTHKIATFILVVVWILSFGSGFLL